MDYRDEKMDRLLDKLRQTKPQPTNPMDLTEAIMQKISCKSQRPGSPFMIWVRTVSASAAAFLFGLLAYQHLEAMESVTESEQAYVQVDQTFVDTACIRLTENGEVKLLESYLCHIKKNSRQNDLLNLKKINK